MHFDEDLESDDLSLIIEMEIVELIDKSIENNMNKFYLMFNHIQGNMDDFYDNLKEIKNVAKDLIKKKI